MITTIIISILAIIYIIIMSMMVGSYIQNKFSLLNSNTFITYGLGFSIYITLITLPFMIIVFFAWSTIILISCFWVINIFIWLFLFSNLKIVNIKSISVKQFSYLILFAVILLVTTRFLITIPNSGQEYFYAKWVKTNANITHLNNGLFINKYQFGEGWYYFQTILLKTLNLDQNFMNYWVIGSIINIFIASVMTGFVYSIIKKMQIGIYFVSIGIAILIAWIGYNGQIENIGEIPLIWNFVLLLTLFVNFIALPKIQYMYLMCIVNYAGWSFSSSQLFLSIAFITSAFFLMLFKKSHLIIEFLIIFSYSIFVMLLILLFDISYIAFSILLVCAILWLFIALYIVTNNINECHEYSFMLVKRRKWIFILSMISIISISMLLWYTTSYNIWLNFKYNSTSLLPTWSRHFFVNAIMTFIFYWISFAILIFIVYKQIVNGIGNNKIKLFLTISGFSIILFFNPLVATLWQDTIVNSGKYYLMKIPTLLILFLLCPFLLNNMKWSIVFSSIISIAIPCSIFSIFATNTFITKNLSLYNGTIKNVATLGKYLNEKQPNKRIAGDTDGLAPYINNNPLSFPVFSAQFNELRNNKLTDTLYENIDNSKIDILIKLKDNVGDFHPMKYGFQKKILVIGVYYIFYK